MKSTGIVRNVDNLDRIVIPKELCKTLGIEPKGALEIFVDENHIILQRHEPEKKSDSKTTGIVRRVDNLDRIVIPKEICKKLGIEPKNALEIFVDETKIILGKYEPSCIFCKEVQNTIMYKRRLICEKCIHALSSLI